MKTTQLLAACAALVITTTVSIAKTGWEDDFDKGLRKAGVEKKIAIVDFTGSDWCSWCIKLNKEVFSQKEFKEYAKANLVLVEVDFPQINPLPTRKQEKHDELAKKFDVKGFPSVLVFDSAGKELGRLGYTEGGPQAFIAQLERITKKTATR